MNLSTISARIIFLYIAFSMYKSNVRGKHSNKQMPYVRVLISMHFDIINV